jgi:hypothetical protein
MNMIRARSLSVLAGLAISLIFSPAQALNGGTRIITCECQATADFVNAAAGDNAQWELNTLYIVVSTSVSMSSNVKVTGHYRGSSEPIWVVGSSTPVDSSGNSLAGNSESANESYFATYDQVLFAANRSAPVTVTVPDEYTSTFINSTEEEVSPGIGEGLAAINVNPAALPPGTLITAKFTDGTTAQYIKNSDHSSYQWTWTGIAHDSKGRLMYRNGQLVVNPNTAGNGSGSFSAPGYGPGNVDWFYLNAPGLCQYGGTVSFDDGEELTSFGFGPC